MLTGLFWGAVDSFAGLFNGFYYIFTGEDTSKVDKFDKLRSMKIFNTPLTQKSHGIGTKRPEQEQNLQTIYVYSVISENHKRLPGNTKKWTLFHYKRVLGSVLRDMKRKRNKPPGKKGRS